MMMTRENFLLTAALVYGGCITASAAFAPPALMRSGRRAPAAFLTRMSLPLTRASFVFDFDNVPYTEGLRHIHSPEHVATTHRLGAPFFRLNTVDWPMIVRSTRQEENRNSIRFTCSTLATRHMSIRMFTRRYDESNLLFFDNNEHRALYKARFTVSPTKGFAGHRMKLDITLFRGSPLWRTTVVMLMPVFLLINGLEDTVAFHTHNGDDASLPQFRQYRRAVLAQPPRDFTNNKGNATAADDDDDDVRRIIRAYTRDA